MEFYAEVSGLYFVNVFLVKFVRVFLDMCLYLSLHSDKCLFLPFSLLARKQQVLTDTLLVSNLRRKHRVFMNTIHAFQGLFEPVGYHLKKL